MSESNHAPLSGYRDPFTPAGVGFGGEERLLSFHLHEAGCLRLAEEWSYPQVRSPFWRLYWNSGPGAWIGSQGLRFALDPSRFLVVPSHTVFDTHGSTKPVVHFWIHFSVYPDLAAKDGVPIEVPCPGTAAVAALARNVRDAGEDRRSLYHLCSALLHQAFAGFQTNAGNLPSRLRILLGQIEGSLDKPQAVTELARRSGMSRGGFIRWFREHLGTSPARYVLQRRIDHACRMLKFSPDPIEEISDALGFANRSHFSRVFQRQMKMGPAAFRKG